MEHQEKLELDKAAIYWTSAALAMGPASTLGFARFSYSLLLPAMGTSLHWNYQKLGALNTVNAVGYLSGAFVATALSNRYGAKKILTLSLLFVAITGALSGSTSDFIFLAVARTLCGLGAGIAFVTGGSLVSSTSSKLGARVTAVALGIYYAGAGVGIVVSGLTIPPLLGYLGPQAWKDGWLLMATFSLLSTAIAGYSARTLAEPPKHDHASRVKRPMKDLKASILAYMLFGAGYISFITFLVAFMKHQGNSQGTIIWLWTILGMSVTVSGPVWGRPLSKLRGGAGFAFVLMVAAVGTLIPLLTTNMLLLIFAAFSFGISLMSTTTAVTIIAQRNLDERSVGGAIGIFTGAIALGQILGPVAVGTLADSSHSLKLGIEASLAMILLSALLAFAQKDRVPLPRNLTS